MATYDRETKIPTRFGDVHPDWARLDEGEVVPPPPGYKITVTRHEVPWPQVIVYDHDGNVTACIQEPARAEKLVAMIDLAPICTVNREWDMSEATAKFAVRFREETERRFVVLPGNHVGELGPYPTQTFRELSSDEVVALLKSSK